MNAKAMSAAPFVMASGPEANSTQHSGFFATSGTAEATHTPFLPPISTVTSFVHGAVVVVHEVLFTFVATGFTSSVVEPPAGTSEATAFSTSACASAPSIRNFHPAVTEPSRSS